MNDYSGIRKSRIGGDSQEKYRLNFREYSTKNGLKTFANIRNIQRSKKLMDDKDDNLPLQAFQSNITSNTYVKISREIKRINVAGTNDDDLSTDFHAAMLLAF